MTENTPTDIPGDDSLGDTSQSGSLRRGKRDLAASMPEEFRPVLICLAGPGRGQRHALAGTDTVIGRSGSANWRIEDTSISRRHTRITYENAGNPREMPRCFLEDLGSRNGTELNGKLIAGRVELKERDRILVGSTVVGFFIRDDAELKHDESLYESATRDVLTGLFNRRQLLIHVKHYLARAQRHRGRLTFMLMDLDHFKLINDKYGHDVGDEALRHVAELLCRGIRESDILARWGGEEFALLLPDTGPEESIALAERIRSNIAKSELLVGSQIVRLTVSVGGTAFQLGDDEEGLFHRADQMLYAAKRGGRNRTEFSDETGDSRSH
ncbi:GGDEF domain-containing protein [Candidatus Poribacteria bacterium]|nr:GGDEF domain-containing protein [Candidatus Poribacteria bacterium]